MTAPARPKLLPSTEIKRVIKAYIAAGGVLGSVDIRADGVAIYPPAESAGNAFDEWVKNNERPPRR